MQSKEEGSLFEKLSIEWLFGIGIIIIVFVMALNWILALCIGEGWPDKGSFGSMFGASSTFITGLAFIGLLITIILQSKAIKIQQTELINQNEQLYNQGLELKLNRETFEQQKFENTFFTLVEMYRKYYNNLIYEGQHNNFNGISAVNANLNEINRLVISPNNIEKESTERDRINSLYERNYDFTTPYLIAVKGLFSWINVSEGKNIDLTFFKTFALNLFSENEQIMILIFLHYQGESDLLDLLFKYNLFGEIKEHDSNNKKHVYRLYNFLREKLK